MTLASKGGTVLLAALALGAGACSERSYPRDELRKILKIPEHVETGPVAVVKNWVDRDIEFAQLEMDLPGGQAKAFSARLKNEHHGDAQPVILIFHGHFSQASDFVGLTKSGDAWSVGLDLARSGYLVIAPQARGEYNDLKRETRLAFGTLMNGKTLMGNRVTDALRWLSYARRHSETIGLLGWSMGGNIGLYLAAVSPEIEAAYVSSAFDSLKLLAEGPFQSPDNYVPDILTFGDKDRIAALIAPRPLLIEQGENDPVAPFEGAVEMSERLLKVYEQFGHSDRLMFLRHQKGHRFSGSDAVVWFKRWLPVKGKSKVKN
ncbi:MAG: dienelactone hydrolase family protein [Elusimicrobia bacterium]|nr:dienelactone hydrolase family protein [Elusimicrobiota bacterium]